MSDELLIRFCSPTLAGIKTGSLFMTDKSDDSTFGKIRELNNILTKHGLRLIPLRKNNKGILVYLYRPDRLNRDLKCPQAMAILECKGYPCGNTDRCIMHLIDRLVQDEAFPHEIGLFLGYPPEDVKGFMEDPSKGVKCIGCWKVYGDVSRANELFERYRKCEAAYCRELKQGKSLESLIVDTDRYIRSAQ